MITREAALSAILTAFVAYPANPVEVGNVIRAVEDKMRAKRGRLALSLWEQYDIAGRPLIAPIFEGISHNDFLLGRAGLGFLDRLISAKSHRCYGRLGALGDDDETTPTQPFCTVQGQGGIGYLTWRQDADRVGRAI